MPTSKARVVVQPCSIFRISLVLFVGVLLGVGIGVFLWIYTYHRTAAEAAVNLSVSDRGTTVLGIVLGLATFVLQPLTRERGWSSMMSDLRALGWSKMLKRLAISLCVPLAIWVILLIVGFRQTHQVIESNSPRIALNWQKSDGYIYMPDGPQEVTPETMKYRRQYVMDISRQDQQEKAVLHTVITFNFPFPLEAFTLDHQNIDSVTFEPVKFEAQNVGSNVKFFGKVMYHNYTLDIKGAIPSMRVRLVILLNHGPSAVVRIGPGSKNEQVPVFPVRPPQGPYYEYIAERSSFSYAGLTLGGGGTYVPFAVVGDDLVVIGPPCTPIPLGLKTSYDVTP